MLSFPLVGVSATLFAGVSAQLPRFLINPINVTTYSGVLPLFHLSFTISNPAYHFGGPTSASCTLDFNASAPTCWTHCTGGPSYFVKITEGTTPTAQNFSLDLLQHYIEEIGNSNNATYQIAPGNATTGYVCEQPSGPTSCYVQDGTGFDIAVQTLYGVSGPSGDTVCSPGCTFENPC